VARPYHRDTAVRGTSVVRGCAVPVLALDDVGLYYAEAGAGPPVLLVHGVQPGAEVWGPVVGDLARRHRVIAYDRRGFGRSVHPPEPDYRRHAADAAALLERLGAAPAAVVGWSWGGVVALELAAARPDLVAALVLEEPAYDAKSNPTLGAVKALVAAQILRRVRGHAAAAEAFLRWAVGRRTYERYPAALRDAVRRDASAVLAEVDAGAGEQVALGRVGTVGCPVTFLLGELSDPVFAKSVARLRRALPGAAVRAIPGAGHAIHADQPARFVDAVSGCVRGGAA
jgi:pimeloyl-ACP methyl ester carboxylesterase